jgi:hypothetical protein
VSTTPRKENTNASPNEMQTDQDSPEPSPRMEATDEEPQEPPVSESEPNIPMTHPIDEQASFPTSNSVPDRLASLFDETPAPKSAKRPKSPRGTEAYQIGSDSEGSNENHTSNKKKRNTFRWPTMRGRSKGEKEKSPEKPLSKEDPAAVATHFRQHRSQSVSNWVPSESASFADKIKPKKSKKPKEPESSPFPGIILHHDPSASKPAAAVEVSPFPGITLHKQLNADSTNRRLTKKIERTDSKRSKHFNPQKVAAKSIMSLKQLKESHFLPGCVSPSKKRTFVNLALYADKKFPVVTKMDAQKIVHVLASPYPVYLEFIASDCTLSSAGFLSTFGENVKELVLFIFLYLLRIL